MKRLLVLFGLALALAAARPAAAEEGEPAVESGPRLRLYGFADVNYLLPLNQSALSQKHGQMYVGNLNVYLDAQLTSRVRALTEVRFSYLPSSASNPTAVRDYMTGISTVSWGGIIIERAWVEYAHDDLLALRAGQFLTPYGIWNVDHGSPTLLTVGAPKLIASDLFPRQQVGLEAYGSRYLGDTRVGYHLTLSNGRIGSNPAYTNKNGRAAFGGRVFVETEAVGSLRVGASGYSGRYTGYANATTNGVTQSVMGSQYDENAVAVDASWKWKKLSVNAEAIGQHFHYTDAGKAAMVATNNFGDSSDHWMGGFYGTVAYELPWYGITPWVMYDVLKLNTKTAGTFRNLAPGITVRALPNVVVKAQLNHVTITGLPQYGKSYDELAGQIAYAF